MYAFLTIIGHIPVHWCFNSIPTKNTMFVVELYVLSVHQLLFHELSFNYLKSIIISFLWLLPILTLKGGLSAKMT